MLLNFIKGLYNFLTQFSDKTFSHGRLHLLHMFIVSFSQRMGTHSSLDWEPNPVSSYQKEFSASVFFIKPSSIKSFIISGNDVTCGGMGHIGLTGELSFGRFTQAADHLKHTPFVGVWKRVGYKFVSNKKRRLR